MSPEMFVALSILTPVVFLGLVLLVLWVVLRLAKRMAGAKGVTAVGTILVGAIATYSMLLYRTCSADPVIIPPAIGEGGEGSAVFACDGPGGLMTWVFLLLALPAIVMAILLVVRGRR